MGLLPLRAYPAVLRERDTESTLAVFPASERKPGPRERWSPALGLPAGNRTFSLEGMYYSTECSSKDPDFNTGPPTPCPALAASYRVSPDKHSCVACLLMSKAPGGGGQVGPHLGEEDTAGSLDPLGGGGRQPGQREESESRTRG